MTTQLARLNGRELAKWEQVQIYDPPISESRYAIRHPDGNEVMLTLADELVIDGVVVNGPLTGWKLEVRRIEAGRLRRDVYFKGAHDLSFGGCLETNDGWICNDRCTVVDHRMDPTHTTVLDDLIQIKQDAQRRFLLVRWELSRVSISHRFVNGRCVASKDEHIKSVVWHRGKTLTKRGARRKMNRLSSPPRK